MRSRTRCVRNNNSRGCCHRSFERAHLLVPADLERPRFAPGPSNLRNPIGRDPTAREGAAQIERQADVRLIAKRRCGCGASS